MEEETGNQEAELKNGAGALELYRPEGQMSESAPDTSHEPHLESGTVKSLNFHPLTVYNLRSLVTIYRTRFSDSMRVHGGVGWDRHKSEGQSAPPSILISITISNTYSMERRKLPA